MVDLLPGKMIKAASPGSGWPCSMISTVTFGSATSGSKSSKLAIRPRRGTAILTSPPGRVAMSIMSSAGNFHASANHGNTPRLRQPVPCLIAVMPSSKSVTSPRNLLIAKPVMRSRSSDDKTTWVPTICAITPPRSISPINTTGTFAASAKPILAISLARRLISAGLPAPSMIT